MVIGALISMAFFFAYTAVRTPEQNIAFTCMIYFFVNIYCTFPCSRKDHSCCSCPRHYQFMLTKFMQMARSTLIHPRVFPLLTEQLETVLRSAATVLWVL
jgi:hypothetical protein